MEFQPFSCTLPQCAASFMVGVDTFDYKGTATGKILCLSGRMLNPKWCNFVNKTILYTVDGHFRNGIRDQGRSHSKFGPGTCTARSKKCCSSCTYGRRVLRLALGPVVEGSRRSRICISVTFDKNRESKTLAFAVVP